MKGSDNAGYGHGEVQDRTKQKRCRCSLPKQITVPPLLLCPACDAGPLMMVRRDPEAEPDGENER